MGFQDDDLLILDQPTDANQEQPQKAKITYATDFLLSLRQLEICKQLPDGFDKSILSEFHDAFHGSQEKARVSGGFATQNFKRTEYSASPPTRRDVNSYSRGSAGKWESRSRDSDSQSDRDSESGRQLGTHSRRPWQKSDHDGLLGSGSSPKLTGFTSGTAVPKPRVNDQNHLNKSCAPYQPPRPYKAVPHNRTATSDLNNDETFGSSEMTNDDRTDEERKRRAEFELMRKEQHKTSQSKQSSGPVSSMDDLVSEAVEYHGNIIDEKIPPTVLAPHSGSTKSSTSLQTPAARPVVPPGFVPPGFANINVLGTSTVKPDTKVETSETNNHLVPGTVHSSVQRTSGSGDKILKQTDDQSHLIVNNHSGGFDLLANGKGLESNTGKMHHAAFVASPNLSTPLLEDMFGNSLTANGGGLSILAEDIDGNLIDKWKTSAVESSKFAHWFVEDAGKGLEDGLLEKPDDLFSLIGGGSTSKFNVDPEAAKSTNTNVPVLTCEDLEQSILSAMTTHHEVPSEMLLQGSKSLDVNAEQPIVGIDALASQHLLSVLQKGPGPNDVDPSLKSSENSTSMDITKHTLRQQNIDKVSVVGKNPTLEAIFGSAFMKELQASDAPVSTKRDSNSDPSRFRVPEDEILITAGDRLNHLNSFHEHVDAVNNYGYTPSNLPLANPGRLGALSAMFRDGRSVRQNQDNQVIPRDSFGTMDNKSMYQNSWAHSSPPQLQSQHTSPGLPMFNQQEAHHHPPQMRFPDNTIRHDPLTAHQFPPSHQIFNQPRPMGFEQLSQHPMMQQMHLQGSATPSHLLRQYSGNLPQPPPPYSQVHGFRQEPNMLHGFHIGHQQPSFHGNGLPTPDIGSGSPHPELLQRLMDMEMRSNPKPSHPLAGHLGRLSNNGAAKQ